MLPRDIDAITFEVIRNGLDTVVDEMALTVMRTAHSGIVKDAMDYSTAFCNHKGEVVAQGLTILMHLGSFPAAVNSVINKFGDSISEGDVFILNDPYLSGGIHLPDIYVILPVFVEDNLEGFACVIAHHTDVGGIVPGSNSTNSTEIYQEGLRIPTLKLYHQDTPVDAVFDFIQANVRVPSKVLGDLRAQIAAVKTGQRGFLEIIERYGIDIVRDHMRELINYSEYLAQKEIVDLPDGTYKSTGYVDADNTPEGPMVIKVALTIINNRVTVDFSGSSKQMKAGINSPLPFTKASVYGALRLVMHPDIPNSEGYTRLIEVVAPPGTVVNPVSPAPCGARGITGFRVMDTVLGALAKAVPSKVPADGEGGNTIISIGGHIGENGFAFVDLFSGARGARPSSDGPDGVAHPASNNSNTPVEIAEVESPIRIEEYGLIPDSGGVGKYRGGLSHVRTVLCLAEEALLQLRSDKRRFLPFGLQGGGKGSPSSNILNQGTDQFLLPTMGTTDMKKGDFIRHEMASGGGWGNPLERDPEMVLSDILDEKVTVEHALKFYGVVFNRENKVVDLVATKKQRQMMNKN